MVIERNKGKQEEEGNKEKKRGQIYPGKKIIGKIDRERINPLNKHSQKPE
jgi:hypothetical protein